MGSGISLPNRVDCDRQIMSRLSLVACAARVNLMEKTRRRQCEVAASMGRRVRRKRPISTVIRCRTYLWARPNVNGRSERCGTRPVGDRNLSKLGTERSRRLMVVIAPDATAGSNGHDRYGIGQPASPQADPPMPSLRPHQRTSNNKKGLPSVNFGPVDMWKS